MESVVPRQGDTNLPWQPYDILVVRWLISRGWDGDKTLERNIQAIVYLHAELVAQIHQDARALHGRMGGSEDLWAACYRYSLAKHLGVLRYDHRFQVIQKRLGNLGSRIASL